MIARILTSRGSSGAVLDYNEEKVLEGNAEVVDVKNLDDSSMTAIYDTFEQYENNPAIAEQVKKKSFHMTLGPGPTENISDQQAAELIHETMQQMGYGDQPYVIYKHYDIDRPHYHIVSTRVNRKGRAIDPRHEGRRLQSLMKELGPKYGFTMGIDKKALLDTNVPQVTQKEYTPGCANVLYTLRDLFEQALKYDYHSLYQFGCIMLAMNVKVTQRVRKDGGYNFILQGLDENGKKVTRLYSMERHLDYHAHEAYKERLAQNQEMGILQADRKVALREISDYCLENTGSALEYASALEEAGIRHIIQRDEETGAIRRVTLVEKNTLSLLDTATRGELYLKAFQDAEGSGRWQKPLPKKSRPVAGAKVRGRVKSTFFTAERAGELKGRIDNALARFRGVPRGKGGGKSLGRSK